MEITRERSKTSDIASRAGQAGDQAPLHWVVARCHDEWNGCTRTFCLTQALRRDGHDHVGSEFDELGREAGECSLSRLLISPAHLKHVCPALHPAELDEARAEGFHAYVFAGRGPLTSIPMRGTFPDV